MQAFAGYLWARQIIFHYMVFIECAAIEHKKVKTIKKHAEANIMVHVSTFHHLLSFFLFDNSSTNWGLYIVQLLFKATQSLFVKLEVQCPILIGSPPCSHDPTWYHSRSPALSHQEHCHTNLTITIWSGWSFQYCREGQAAPCNHICEVTSLQVFPSLQPRWLQGSKRAQVPVNCQICTWK